MDHQHPKHPPTDHSTQAAASGGAASEHAMLTPGKVAIWLFLATEVMFFTGLIGSYIVLRAGSPPASYSNLYSPGPDLKRLKDTQGVRLAESGPAPEQIAEIVQKSTGLNTAEAKHFADSHGTGILPGMPASRAAGIRDAIIAAGGKADLVPLTSMKWPQPYNNEVNPLSIDLTAANTFILICSSVTMVLALSAIQQGKKFKLFLYLLATVLIGSTFLGIQVIEYRQLLFNHHYPIGESKTGHFSPDVSLFASTFFTMTGFHGAHVAVGVFLLAILLLRSMFGGFTREDHGAVELVGLYWHFVDLVWILLFTVVYLI